MNAIVEKPTGKLTPVKDHELEAMVWKAKAAELKRENRSLRKELKDERRHTVEMLAIMRRMNDPRMQRLLVQVCDCEQCTCTPSRADVLMRR